MSIVGFFKRPGPNGFGYNTTTEQVTEGLDLSGKTWLVTGCNSGLGLETVRILEKRGARVIGAARTVDKARAAIGDRSVPVACELSEPASVRAAVEHVKNVGPIDGIIANAGIMALPEPVRKHGYELQFFTNHVGHFILVTGLLDLLSDDGRVVMLSSSAHNNAYSDVGIRFDDLSAEKHYSPWGAYGQSKLANLLFAKHLATRLKPGQTANSVHPGVIATNLARHMNGAVRAFFGAVGPIVALKSVRQGAATQTLVAVHPDAATVTGEYWADCNPAKTSAFGRDAALAAKLWDETERIVAGLS